MSGFAVSVVMPAYNGEKCIAEALECLVSQSLGDRLQILVVDDGSEDQTLSIARDYERSFPERMRVVHTKNGGAAHARNVALALAEGDYVGFLDCDDSADVTMYEHLYELATREDADIATCGYLRVEGDDVQRRDYARRPCFGFSVAQKPSLIGRNVPYVHNKLFRRSFLVENGLRFDEDLRIYEDLVFTYSSFALANKVVRVHKTLYVYNFAREGSLTSAFSEKRLDLVPAFERLVGFYRERGLFLHVEDELLKVFLTHLYVALENSSPESLRSPLVRRFTAACFAYLDRDFPWWRKYDAFFKRTGRSYAVYGHRALLDTALRLPGSLRARLLKKGNGSRWGSYVRPGKVFAEAQGTLSLVPKTVVIDSQRGANLNGNMFYLLRELLSNPDFEGWRVYLTYAKPANKKEFAALLRSRGLSSPRVTLQQYNGRTYAERLATSQMVLTDTSLPVYYVKRPGQTYLNTWHGTPLKTLGRDMAEGGLTASNLTKNFLAADYLAFQGPFMDQMMRSAYGYDGLAHNVTLLEGYPRNEPLCPGAELPCGLAEFFDGQEGVAEGVQRIAYLPTWRGSASTNAAEKTDVGQILTQVDELLGDDQVLYAKLHPYDSSRIPFSSFRHVRRFPKRFETYEFLAGCDALVTDYSSVLFDFAASGKPVVLFAYDQDAYLADRGLYVGLDELGLPCVETAGELVRVLRDSQARALPEGFAQTYVPNERADCSRVLLETCVGAGPEGLKAQPTSEEPLAKTTLFFCDDFRSVTSTKKLLRCLAALGPDATPCLTYDHDKSCNHALLEKTDHAVRFLGRYAPLSATTGEEREVLACVDADPAQIARHRDAIDKILAREIERSWPGVRFDTAVVFGRESVWNLLLAPRCAGRSVLVVLDDAQARGLELLPAGVVGAFDAVFVRRGVEVGTGALGAGRVLEFDSPEDVAGLLAGL